LAAPRRRHPRDDRLEQLGYAGPLLGGHREDLLSLGPDQVHDLLRPPLRLGAREVDLVEHGNDLEAGVHRQEQVAQRLCLNALGRVHHQDGPFAGGERAGDLVREVHVSRRVDQVELVRHAVTPRIAHPYGVQLDRDAALALEIHGVEELLPHLPLLDRPGGLDETVREGRLAVIDVGDDAEVTDARLRHGGNIPGGGRPWGVTLYAGTQSLFDRPDPPAASSADRPLGRPADQPHRASAADLGMLLVCLIWGVNFSVMKLAIAQMPPLPFTAVRFTVASLLLWLALRLIEGPARLASADLRRLVILGVVGNTFYQIAFILGLEHTTATNSALIVATVPTVVAVIAGLMGFERVTPRMWCGIGL